MSASLAIAIALSLAPLVGGGGDGRPSLELGPGEPRPASYAWSVPDARGAVPVEMPFVARTPVARIDQGAAGVEPGTLLYLPFDEGAGEGTRELVSGGEAEPGGGGWRDGRFGAALALGPGETFAGGFAPGSVPKSWTLELWVRTEAAPRAAARLVSIPGVVEVGRTPAGRVRARLDGPDDAGLALWSRGETRANEWSHVAVVRDGGPLRSLRLVLDGVVRVEPLPGPGATEPREDADLSLTLGDPRRAGVALAFDEIRLVARALSTAELFAREAPAETREHELVLSYADGTARRLELWAGTLERPDLARREDRERGALDGVVVTGEGLAWTDARWERDRPVGRPLARTTHPTLGLGGGRVWILGGEVRDTHIGPMVNLADTWIYRLDETRWERVETSVAPPPICHQGAAYSPDHGLVLYAGGWRNDEGRDLLRDGTWTFDVARGEWTEREPAGDPLPPTAGAPLVYHPPTRRFVLLRNDGLFAYDPEGDRWTRLPPPIAEDPSGEPMPWRPGTSGMAAALPDGRIFLFGGERAAPGGGLEFMDDTAIYDPAEHRYVLLEPEPAPAARVRSGFAYDERRGRLVLCGGVLGMDSQRFDDLWTFDVGEERWRRHAASGSPGRRGGYYGMARDAERDVFVLACGRASRSRFLDEVWRLRFAEDEPGRARYVFDRTGFPGRDRLVVRWRGAAGAVRLRARTSPDGATWSAWSEDEVAAERFVAVELELAPGGEGEGPVVTALDFAVGAGDDRGADAAERSALLRLRDAGREEGR